MVLKVTEALAKMDYGFLLFISIPKCSIVNTAFVR